MKPVLSRNEESKESTIMPMTGKKRPKRKILAPSFLLTIALMNTRMVSTIAIKKKSTIVIVPDFFH
ncbi:MAG: hypothetical protein IPI62_14375 [Bacteroidetes bacterium]|nr:hypothetical protein [Bacteroidota bacterium]